MNYFCKATVEAGKGKVRTFYPILTEDKESSSPPKLEKEVLFEQHEYKEFVSQYKPKSAIMVDYTLYQTEEKIHAALQPEVFEDLIDNGKAVFLSSGELLIEPSEKKDKHGVVRKKKKTSPFLILGIFAGAGVIALFSFMGGKMLGMARAGSEATNTPTANTAEDGLIIPAQNTISDDAEQITVTIDRSYSATPVEDLQLKGAVSNGKAVIELPQFDKTDYFTHVQGYSWGFTSDPNGKKIEYYGGREYEFSADTKLYRVLVKYGGGSGTKDDPYLIDYYDQLELMGEEKARGYFKQIADISFPEWASHTPISTVNELKADPKAEYFEYDGGGFLIENLDAPLFDKVSGAVIKNVNIRSSNINTQVYRDYGFIVCNAYNYHYKTEDGTTYETGETLIQHCSVSHSAIRAEIPQEETPVTTTAVVYAPEVVPPDLIEYDDEGNPIETTTTVPEETKKAEFAVGGITGNGGQIEDCYVTDFGIFAYLDDYILYAGGISGKPANVINSVVYYYSANGNIFNAGGIVGSAEGARTYDAKGKELPEYYGGNIKGCVARNIILNSEMAAGGIAAVGSSDAENALISNSYANELTIKCGEFEDTDRLQVIKQGVTGGVIALDGSGKHGHTIINTVSLSDFPVIGKKDKSNFDDTVRVAPAFAFYQENIQTVINRNTVTPKNPKEIFTGCFMFGEQGEFGDETGSLAYPETIKDLFAKTVIQEESQNG